MTTKRFFALFAILLLVLTMIAILPISGHVKIVLSLLLILTSATTLLLWYTSHPRN